MIKSIMSPEHFDLLKEERERRWAKATKRFTKFTPLQIVSQNYPLYPHQMFFIMVKHIPDKTDLLTGYIDFVNDLYEKYSNIFKLYKRETETAKEIKWLYDIREKDVITLISETFSPAEKALLTLDMKISRLFGISFEYKRKIAPFLFNIRYDLQVGTENLSLMFETTTMAQDLLDFCNEYLFAKPVRLEVFKCLFFFSHNVNRRAIYVKNIGATAFFLSKLAQCNNYLKTNWQSIIAETEMLHSDKTITSAQLSTSLSSFLKTVSKQKRYSYNVDSRRVYKEIENFFNTCVWLKTD